MLRNRDVGAYVDQAITSQDFLAEIITFPLNQMQALTTEDYDNYFSLLNDRLSERKRRCDLLSLTRGNESLPGLLAYLATNPTLFFNNLELHLTQPLDQSFFEILHHLSAKGLASIKLVNATVNNNYLNQLLKEIETYKIATDIELPAGHEAIQQQIDALVSICKREKRIASYQQRGVSGNAEEKEEKGQGKAVKRERRQAKMQYSVDVEVQVEVAIEPSVEKAAEEQQEDKEDKEFIHRDEFIRRAKAKEFKLNESIYKRLQGHEQRTWDHWLGNINQWVVGPKINQVNDAKSVKPTCGLFIRSIPLLNEDASRYLDTKYDYVFVLVQSTPRKPVTGVYLVKRDNESYGKTLDVTVRRCEHKIGDRLSTFLKVFYHNATKNNFKPLLQLPHEQIQAGCDIFTLGEQIAESVNRKPATPQRQRKIFDASVMPEDEKSIDALKNELLKKNCEILPQLYPNPNLSVMTTSACEKLLQHQAQLQYGLDFHHLPSGFEIITTTINGKITQALDYSAKKARIKTRDLLAIQFCTRPEASPLSQDLFNIWLQNNNPSTLEKALMAHYQALVQKGYNRSRLDQFKKYLLTILHMSENFLPKVGAKVEELIKAAKQHQKDHMHLLFLFIKDKPELIKAVETWQRKLLLTTSDLNGLLTVYDAYGEKGLLDLFASWQNTDPEILTQLHQHHFVHCATYQPFLDEQYKEAINILNHFSKEKRAWWNALFKQHCLAVGYDHLFPLVKAFQAFVAQVEAKNLKFYENCHFKDIKSLPTALSRMLTIINNTSSADQALVWEGITKLDLQSNGAIRVINDAKNSLGSGQLLLPEMQLQPEFYFENHDANLYSVDDHGTSSKHNEKPGHGYHAIQVTSSLWDSQELIPDASNSLHQLIGRSKNQKELEQNYYRFLAGQENRLSLDFYRKAAKIIDTEVTDNLILSNFDVRKGLYSLIAAATSGFEASLLLNNEARSLEEISELCRTLLKTSIIILPDVFVHESLVHNVLIKHTNPMSPLPYLKKMMSIMQKAFTIGITDLFFTPGQALQRLDEFSLFNSAVSIISRNHKYAFYNGIQYINEAKLSHKDLFTFGELATKLNELGGLNYSYSNASIGMKNSVQKIRSGLISLMSTFQLSENITFKNINTIISTDPSKERLLGLLGSSFKLLSHISPATSKQLTENDLTLFIQHLQTTLETTDPALLDMDQLAVQLVKEKFAAHFDKDFFNSLQSSALSAEIQDKIRQGFFESLEEQNWVKSILSSFKSVDDKFHRMNTVNSLIRITHRLSVGDRTHFLKALTSLNAHQDSTLEQLNDLLAEVGNRNNINDLIFLQDFSKNDSTTRLIPKITLYYQQVRPFISGVKPKEMTILDIQPLITRLVFNFNDDPNKFRDFLAEIMGMVYALVTEYPNEKQAILDLVSSFIKQNPGHEGFVVSVSHFIRSLHALIQLHDPDLMRSLSDHYRKKPLVLRALLTAIQAFNLDQQHYILSMISVLLNNGRKCTPKVIQEFLSLCKAKPALLNLAQEFFSCPPYPTFKKMIIWHNLHQAAPDYEKAMQASYQAYNLQPCPREPENGFKLDEARKYALQFKGMHFTEDELQALETNTNWAATQTASKLKEELKKLSTDELAKLPVAERQKKYSQLLAILAELLYRSKGSAGGKGKSYEINTVQYLAILSLLKSNGHITSEIATGEGKSRIMMLAIACQYALGKTVDFVTSDMQLAQRDYLEYQAFFKMLGAETRLISATSAPDVYRIKGINFSDASNLSLFRNKARSNGEGRKVIDPDLHKRALLLDEADRTFYDISETRFNYSQEANENIKNMEWVYPMLVRFFSQKDPKQSKLVRELYLKDIDGCNKALKDFIKAQPEYPLEITEEMFERFQALTLGQIESWQEAAVTALDLKLGKDYAIEPNVLIETTKGPKLASEARLIYGHRLSRNSKFSFGVHQCLAALLNIELKDPNSATSKKCAELNKKANATVTHPFFIHPEKQIVYSTTSKSFLDEYHQGHLWAVTGTGGAIIEREEAAALFGKDNDEFHAMEFVTVPRKEELQRLDRLLRLTGNFDQRVAAILEEIVEARKVGRPVLLICENDQEAEKIRDALKALAQKLPAAEQIPGAQWQYVDSTTSSEEERAKIETAGEPGIVTISTSRLARGTDIKTKAAGGLRVLGSYLPRERDLWQMFGRGGRYGALGDARLIVDTEQLCRQLGKKKLDSHFFFANEFFVKNQQSRFDREKQVERLIRNALSDFRIKITDAFFKYFDKLKDNGVAEKERQEKLMLWSDFTKKVDQLWNQAWPDLAHLMSQPVIQMHQVKRRLAKFKAAAQAEWEGLRGALKADKELPLAVSDLALDPRTEHLVRRMMPKRKYTMADRTLVYQTYDKALDGRAAVYDELFADWKASWRGQRKWFANTRAWWQGHGILFADTRAWWAGNRLLFASLRAWWNKNNKVVAAPVISANLMEALGNYRDQELKPFVCELDATQFLNPQKGDLLLSFKIQLVEAVLDFAHDRIEKGKTVSRRDMKDMYDLLVVVRDTKVSKQTEFVTAVSDKLAHTTVRFFGRSLQKDLNKIIEQRSQEQQEDGQAVLEDAPGWRPVVAAGAA